MESSAVYCIAQAATDSSWLTVDADTYRYFFSASAQVFAAIFAVVAIAANFRISEINARLDRHRESKRSIAISYRYFWDYSVFQEFFGSGFDLAHLQNNPHEIGGLALNRKHMQIKNRIGAAKRRCNS